LSTTERAVKEIAHRINKQICTSKGKFFLVACTYEYSKGNLCEDQVHGHGSRPECRTKP